MIRVHVICEGQTEEMFVNEVLYDVFIKKNVHLIPSLIGKPGHKGGNFKYDRLLSDLKLRLLGDKTAYCTTFFDFYGLPSEFPGKSKAIFLRNITDKANVLQNALTDELRNDLGEDSIRRFIPYVQMYEFEGLLFSSPTDFASGINQPPLSEQFQKIRNLFKTPEEINDSAATAPSKRILSLYSSYDKPLHGSLAAIEIGLDTIRRECLRFDAWLQSIEGLLPV